MEKQEPICTVGTIKCCSHYGKHMAILWDIKKWIIIWSNNSTQGISPKELKSESQNFTCTHIFSVGLFTIAKTWKQHKSPLTDEWTKNMKYIYI